MSVDVYVYDNLMASITAPIDIIEQDDTGWVLKSGTSAHIGPSEYGVKLSPPVPAIPIQVVVDDPAMVYAATTLAHLNTTVTIRLDVALYPLPKPPMTFGGGGGGGNWGGGGPNTPGPSGPSSDSNGPSDVIASNVRSGTWTEDEGKAVASLANSILRAKSCKTLSPNFITRLKRWCDYLRTLDIDPDTFGTNPGPEDDGDGGNGNHPGFAPSSNYRDFHQQAGLMQMS